MKNLRTLFVLIPASLLLAGACPREQFSMDGSNTSTASALTPRALEMNPTAAAATANSGIETVQPNKPSPHLRTPAKARRPMPERSRIWLT